MEIEELKKIEEDHIMQTYARFDIIIDSGKGCYLFGKNGKKYLDMIGGLATASIGYSHPDLVKAIKKQSEKLINSTNLFYTEPQILLAKELADYSGMQKSFFSNSGSEANEVAIKLARKFKGKAGIIACEHGFHGRTLGALSATWKERYKKDFEPLVPKFKHIPYNDINALKKAINEDTAAFIVEPIQGEAGIIMPSPGYLKEVETLCKDTGVLLIIDEVQTSLRTGKMFCFQHEEIEPDIVTLAKGIGGGVPIGITLAHENVADALKKGDQGSTFGGNSLSCAAGLTVLSTIKRDNLIEKAENIGAYFIGKLHELKVKKKTIKEIRGKGLMIAIELSVPVKDIIAKCAEKGILINKVGEYTLRFLPPLTIAKHDIYKVMDALKEFIE